MPFFSFSESFEPLFLLNHKLSSLAYSSPFRSQSKGSENHNSYPSQSHPLCSDSFTSCRWGIWRSGCWLQSALHSRSHGFCHNCLWGRKMRDWMNADLPFFNPLATLLTTDWTIYRLMTPDSRLPSPNPRQLQTPLLQLPRLRFFNHGVRGKNQGIVVLFPPVAIL